MSYNGLLYERVKILINRFRIDFLHVFILKSAYLKSTLKSLYIVSVILRMDE